MTGAAGNVDREVVTSLLAKGAWVKAAALRAGRNVLPDGVLCVWKGRTVEAEYEYSA